MSNRLFCFGLGYTGTALAAALVQEGWAVAGSCREPEARERLLARGFEVALFDRQTPLAAARLEGSTHILVSVPPDEAGDAVCDDWGEAIAGLKGLAWLGYLSTTGVYGDRRGGWVDEGSRRRPTSPRSQWRRDAEDAWLGLWRRRGLPLHIFRLAGIYGPGRGPLEGAAGARRIDKPGQVFSRIHLDDIVAVLRASMARPRPGRIYNVCDDEAAPPQDVVAYACELLGLPVPPLLPYAQAELSPLARSFYANNKRVRNDRIRQELGVELKYPNYRAGLRAILASRRQAI